MRGGPRKGSGRRKKADHERSFVAHRPRPELGESTALHVALRMIDGYPSLRHPIAVAYVRRAIQLAHRDRFRVVHFSVQSNHVHLIVEADDEVALSRGMQGLKIRLARRLNTLFGRRGTMFSDRYHTQRIETPLQARSCLAYVLGNVRRHADRTFPRGWIDPYSSAPTFEGWSKSTTTDDDPTQPGITADPESSLLRTAWREHGLLDPDEAPHGV